MLNTDLTMAVDKLLDLDQCLGQLKGVQSKWREFGEALFVPSTYIEQIEAHYTSDAAAGLTEVIDYWIRNCSGQPTWRELANALRLVGESNLAKEFLEIYETGENTVQCTCVYKVVLKEDVLLNWASSTGTIQT